MTRTRAWGLALAATLTMTVSYLDRQTLAVLAPTVTTVFGLQERDYGLLMSAFSIAYLLGTPAAGWLVDRVGARRGLPVSLLLWTLVAAAHALAPGFGMLFTLRILLGFAEAPSFPGAAQTVQRALPPQEQARGMGILFTGSSLGAMVAPKLATWLNSSLGWQEAFVGTALVGLLWVPLWLWLTSTPEAKAVLDTVPEESAGKRSSVSLGELMRNPAVLRALLVVLASAPAISFSLLWGAKYLVKVHGLTQAQVGNVLWIPPVAFDLGSVIFGDLASRQRCGRPGPVEPARGLVLGAAVLGAAMIGAAQGGSLEVALLSLSLSMAGGGGLFAVATADMMARVPPGSVSTAGGITAAAQSLTYIVLNPLLGRYLDGGGTYQAILLALGFWVLPGSVLWVLWVPASWREEGSSR
ncbi:MAG: MFS transporter [Myxococcales bacterium]|nr:MFS transporter [Polyangiaceae bacterium]MDW8247876.1 MFS transporter [Myxococcales bacterium]